MADINVGQLSEAINDKMGRDAYNADNDAFANLTQSLGIDYVVEWQAPTAENNYTWYRLYASGWLEQGGQSTTNTVNLPKSYSNIAYNVQISFIGDNNNYPYFAAISVNSKTTTSFTYGYDTTVVRVWEAKGMSDTGES